MQETQQTPTAKPSPTSEQIRKRFSDAGINKKSFLEGTLSGAQLQAYLMSVAPFEIINDTVEQEQWNAALVVNKARCFPENAEKYKPPVSE